MSLANNPDSEIITDAQVLYLYALLVTFKDGYRCVFDISERVSESIIHQPFRDNPLFVYDFVIAENGFKIDWNIDYASDNIRECSVALDDVMKFVRDRSRHRKLMMLDESDPFAKEKLRNRSKNCIRTPFQADPLGKELAKAILRIEPLAPFVFKLTYKDGYKCIFDMVEYLANHSNPQEAMNGSTMISELTLDPWGMNASWGTLVIHAERIRELSVPMDEITQWIREETHRIHDGLQKTI